MDNKITHIFWDTGVFIALLNNDETRNVADIQEYLEDARKGKCRIYASTITIAEILPGNFKGSSIGSFVEFVEDLSGAIVLVEASPHVMQMAAALRALPYQKSGSRARKLHTPDAIILASCLSLQEVFGVPLDHFHTFDDGKVRGVDGKGIPLLSFEQWCEGLEGDPLASEIISLRRTKPTHPEPRLMPIQPSKRSEPHLS